MGEVDEISYKLGQIKSELKTLYKENERIMHLIDDFPIVDIQNRLQKLESRANSDSTGRFLDHLNVLRRSEFWYLIVILVGVAGVILGIPVPTIYRWRYRGDGPPGFRVGRHLRFRWSDVEAWIDSRLESRRTGVDTRAARLRVRPDR